MYLRQCRGAASRSLKWSHRSRLGLPYLFSDYWIPACCPAFSRLLSPSPPLLPRCSLTLPHARSRYCISATLNNRSCKDCVSGLCQEIGPTHQYPFPRPPPDPVEQSWDPTHGGDYDPNRSNASRLSGQSSRQQYDTPSMASNASRQAFSGQASSYNSNQTTDSSNPAGSRLGVSASFDYLTMFICLRCWSGMVADLHTFGSYATPPCWLERSSESWWRFTNAVGLVYPHWWHTSSLLEWRQSASGRICLMKGIHEPS